MKIIRDIVYDPEFADINRGDLYLPDQVTAGAPVVLAIHGGGWCALDRSSFAGVAAWLAETGKVVFNIDYRLTGAAPWPACGDDCLKAAEFLQSGDLPVPAGADRTRIGCIGASAGGHLALMTAMRFSHAAYGVSISGIADPLPYLKVSPGAFISLFSHRITIGNLYSAFPESLLDRPGLPPLFCTHMLGDQVVPAESQAEFVASAAERGIRVESYFYFAKPGLTGHGIWIPESSPHRLLPELEEKISGFIEKCSAATAEK